MRAPKDFAILSQLKDDTELYTQGGEDSVRGDFKFTLGELKDYLNNDREKIPVISESSELAVPGIKNNVAIYRNGILMENVDTTLKRVDAVVIDPVNEKLIVHSSFKFRVGERIEIF